MFERMVTAAGASSHKRADEYIQENKAFIFASEINSSIESEPGEKEWPKIHLKLERYLIQKVIWYNLVTISWASCRRN